MRLDGHFGDAEFAADLFVEQAGYDVHKVLRFIGSKPPEFFDHIETD